MKKIILNACISLVFFTMLAGCNNGFSAGRKTPAGGTGDNSGKFIPDDIIEKKLSELTAAQQAEIKSLYGCYWPGGIKQQCVEIGDDKLIVYSVAMSSGYENIRWAKVSSMWICCSYLKTDTDYAPKDRRVALKFLKDGSGNLKVLQYVVPMGMKSGPFNKGKAVEKIDEGGKTYYVYDKNNSASPKMLKPIPR
ncbi:hypothetical protein [Treponema lecithinolyticum]